MPSLSVVTQFYYPEQIGTAFYTRDLVLAIAERGEHSVQVVTGEPYYPEFKRDPRYDVPVRSELIDGVPVHRLRTYVPRPGSALSRILSELNFLVRAVWMVLLGRIPRSHRVVCFAPGMLTVIVGKMLAANRGHVLTIVHDLSAGLAAGTNLVSSAGIARFLSRVEAFVLNRSDTLAVLSPQMRNVLVEMGVKRRIEIVPLWIRDVVAGRQPSPEPDEPIVMYSGSLGRKQGVHRLLALARGLQEAMPAARLLIRGQGSMESVVAAGAERLPNVEIGPLVPEERLAESLGGGCVHVVLQDPDSANFSVPSKVFSTLAAGRPVVATANPGTPLHDVSCLCPAVTCVDPDDPTALLSAVLGRLEQPAQCLADGWAGRRFVLENHARQRLVDRLLALFPAVSPGVVEPVGLKAGVLAD
jgi:colanic acid biosynthesis glycosyl transferase WcaI